MNVSEEVHRSTTAIAPFAAVGGVLAVAVAVASPSLPPSPQLVGGSPLPHASCIGTRHDWGPFGSVVGCSFACVTTSDVALFAPACPQIPLVGLTATSRSGCVLLARHNAD
eukprot:3272508-Prymnesium_polylepis.2